MLTVYFQWTLMGVNAKEFYLLLYSIALYHPFAFTPQLIPSLKFKRAWKANPDMPASLC